MLRFGLVAALLGSLTPALADAPATLTPVEFAVVRQECEQVGADLVACAQRFIDYYNQAPTEPTMDEVLYNAGVMFDAGKSRSAAMQTFALLRRSFPRSKLAPRALARQARFYADVAMYDRAAALLEEYAKKYAGEKDAYAAISDAVYYRKAIGDDDNAIEDTKYFIKVYGTKQPREAANAHFSLTAIYEKRGDSDSVVKHLREYIRQYGSRGGDDRLVIAYAKIGQALWERSCPVKQVDGACVRVERPRTPRCEASWPVTQPVRRDPRQVEEALAAFAMANKLYEKFGGSVGGDEAGARYYHATAKLATADAAVEAQRLVVPPVGISGRQSLAAQKKFDTWVIDETRVRQQAIASYEQILSIKDAATSIAAAARIARETDDIVISLMTQELPAELLKGTNREARIKAHCDGHKVLRAPLQGRAIEGYQVCLAKATELGWFDDAARRCERGLVRLQPEVFPPLREVSSRAVHVTAVLALEPPL